MRWTDEAIRLMERAASRSAYYDEIADLICAHLPAGSRVCDAGCGLGHLSLALAARGMSVTAVDISEAALAVLRRLRREHDIDIRCGRVEETVPDTPYDAMVFSLFGSVEEVIRTAKAQCRGDVFIVARNDGAHRFSVRRHALSHPGYGDMRRVLSALGIKNEGVTLAPEIGQPFRNIEEARRFFALYSRDDAAMITDQFLRERLVHTGDPDFPLYLPHRRQLGVMHFRTADLPPQADFQSIFPAGICRLITFRTVTDERKETT